MKTKNIFKVLAMAMLMPAMLLTTACSNDDNFVTNNNEQTVKNGYELPVTINVTRQGDDATTRATFNDDTKKLSFSSGDKLFVKGMKDKKAFCAGILTWVSGGTFSGTIYTKDEYTGTVDELLSSAQVATATLLPAGYETYNFISVSGSGYTTNISFDESYSFATSKATAVEQLSRERANSYSSGFALVPGNAILSFTITDLTPSTNFTAILRVSGSVWFNREVTTDGSGNATFAVGVTGGSIWSDVSLTMGGNDINIFTSSKILTAGKIYNITRSAEAVATGHALSSAVVGDIICSDGLAYAGYAYNKLPSGVTAKAKVCYVSGGHGLALAMADEDMMDWRTAISTCSGKTPTVSGCTWKLATKDEWNNMISGIGGYGDLRDGFNNVGGTNMVQDFYWSSTEIDSDNAWRYGFFFGGDEWFSNKKNDNLNCVRACLSF